MTHPDSSAFYAGLATRLDESRRDGLFKTERVLASRQETEVVCDDGVIRITKNGP